MSDERCFNVERANQSQDSVDDICESHSFGVLLNFEKYLKKEKCLKMILKKLYLSLHIRQKHHAPENHERGLLREHALLSSSSVEFYGGRHP